MELKGSVEAALGLPMPLAELLRGAGIAELADAMLALLETGPAEDVPPPRALSLAGDQSLSPGQKALWFLERLAPAAGAYNIVVAARVREGLDAEALSRAVALLAARHEGLRTVIRSVEGEPVQRVLPDLEPDVSRVEAGGWDDGELLGRLEAEAWRPFDLQAGPPLRVRIYERADGERVLLLAVHHLVCDFWSLAVAARELAALYVQETGGPRAGLEPPALRYSDFVHWQADRLAGARGGELRDYWSGVLAGVQDLDLPTDRPRPAVQTWRGSSRTLRLPPELVAGLRSLAAPQGATLFMALLAAFEVQLGRTARQDDFAVGIPTSGRGAPELAGILGYFVNPVAVRADLSGEPSYRGLLDRVRRTVLAGLERADLPFPWVAERLRPVRDPARSPIFQVVFALQRGRPVDDPGLPAFALGEGEGRISLGEVTLESVRLRERRALFELTLFAAETPEGGLLFSLEHNADLFDPATVERMLGHWRTLLEGIAADPAAPLSRLPLLTAPERQQVFIEWNDTGATFPGGLCLHHLVAAQAARTPEAVAVVGERERLTYRELMERAGRFARFLRGLGVGPETRVGFCLERTPEMIAAMLGILQAGGAYLPLDPSYPRERLEVILADGGAAVLLTESALADRLPAFSGPVVLLDEDRERIEAAAELVGFMPEPSERNLAYIIYTSGSTGRPKGVAIEHRSAVTLVHWGLETYPWEVLRVSLAATSVCFDISVFEIFAPLAAGGRLLVVPNVLSLRHLAAEELTIVNAVPSPMAELAGGPFPESLRVVNLGGEPLKPELVERIYAHPQVERVYNLYGPSEDTTYSTVSLVPKGASAVTIGRPIANTQARVLGRRGEPLPAGVPGELFLGGAGVSRGYLGRPEATAERYVPDPFGPPGARMYRTGDRVRLLPDGQLDYLGRLDYQVKLHGVRIELGEIETVLEGHPLVRQAVAAMRSDGPEARLVAYVVPEAAEEDAAEDLQAELASYLRDILPAAMIPTAWVVLPALPLSPNGKVDRRALPAPSRAGQSEAAAARNLTEESLAMIFREVLGVEGLGIHDDFFDLGGHSLMAIRAAFRISEAFAAEVPVSVLFQAPTVAEMAEWLESALPAVDQAAPIRRVPRRPGWALPASFAQRRLWFLDRLEPGSAVYNLPGWLRLSGPLDLPALAAGLAEIARRHEVLRTVLRAEAGEPMQVAGPEGMPLPLADLGGLPAFKAPAEAERLAREAAGLPFDLARGPLHRALAVRLGPEEHALLLTLHHVVADAWSLGVLFRELAALYEAFSAGRPSPLPELPVQYADYAVWQRRRLQGEVLDSQLAWWRERLAGAPALELPADRPRLAARSFRGGVRKAVLPGGIAEAAGEIARREGATPFMVLLAVFQAQLARYTRDESVTVGSPVAHRDRSELEELIGFFVNALALRTAVGDDPSFLDLLARVREVCLGAYAHQDVPFERLVEELRPERQLARNPLFQVVFVLEEPLPPPRLGGLAAEPRPVDTGTAKFDLTLAVEPGPEAWSVRLEYDADLFDPATADRILGHWRTLLEGIAADPSTPLSRLPLLTQPERQQVFSEWNDTGAGFPGGLCLHHLVAAQAARTPEAVAVVGERERLTYRELMERAGRFARFLRGLGVGPETRVGFCLERAPEMIAAMLGILQAGGAYLPLDPSYPRERLEVILTDGGAAVLLTESALADRLPAFSGPVVLLDEDRERIEAAAEPVGFMPEPSERNLAYIIYTSGSTGRPKGVAIEHRNAVTLVHWGLETYPREVLRVSLAATSVCFDISVFEIFAPLAAGGRLLVVPNVLSLRHLAAEELTIVNAVPSPMAELAGGPFPESLRVVNLGGEPLKPELVERIYAHPQVERVYNLYGPSEDTTYSTVSLVPKGASQVTIGRPVANTRARVLGRHGELLPAGVPGELFLGGVGVSRGYLGRPDVTAERYVPDPFGPPGARMYRSGDRARLLPDGQLDYLGRLDYQVKLHGVRIELGEIEAVLEGHPSVRQAVAAVRTDGSEPRLVAYVVLEAAAAGENLQAELAAYLRGILPAAMVPTAWVVLPELPLSPNGKVDRRALPAPSRAGHAGAVAPRNASEKILVGIFREALGVEELGVHDDFFELGGHSLMAIRAAFRISEAFGTEVPVSVLFQAPTVAEMAEWLESARPDADEVATIRRVPRKPGWALPASFAQRRLWFLDRLEPGSAVYNLPGWLCLSGLLDLPALAASLEEIARRHEVLRTVLRAEDGEPMQVAGPAGMPLPLVDLGGLSAVAASAEAERLAREEAGLPFDLARGPLHRTLAVRLGPEEHALLLTLHHVVADAWSLGVLFKELAALYQAFSAGRSSPLPELPIQYADYAVWQRERLQGEALEAQLAWWRERLAGAPVLELPADRPRLAARSFRGGVRRAFLPGEIAEAAGRIAGREGATPFMVLLAAFQAQLARYTRDESVTVGSPVAHRDRSELEGLIGFFVNALALRTPVGDDPSFLGLLARVREVCLGAYAHQEVPFERLVEELRPERQLARNPLFQVVFVLEEPLPPLPLGSLAVEARTLDTGTAKFDLTLVVEPGPEAWSARLEYDADLFDPATVDRMLGHWRTLLEGIAAEPSTPLSRLPLLTRPERQHVFTEWNDTGAGFPRGLCLHHLVAAQAARTPVAVAVVGERERLTYRELMERSGRLARFLRGLGVGPETRVGFCLERTPEMIAAMLGILQAGGAYLPLDPSYPRERLEVILTDGGAAVLLTESSLAERLPAFSGPVVLLDIDRERIAAAPDPAGSVPEAGERNLAYIIYTSGSTGRPKGVAIEHHSAVTLVHWGLETFPPEALESSLAATSICFDISVFEIFAPLAMGGRLIVVPNVLALPGLTEEITIVNAVPSPMAEVAGGPLPAGLRAVNLGGEPLRADLVDRIYAHPQVERVYNLYGPSEDTTYSTFSLVPRGASRVTVGRPVADTQARVLGRSGELLPAGVPGELFLSGGGLARGYLGRPDLTAERFVPDPHGPSGSRMYRTGDRMRLLPDGQLDFLGRFDHQVKIRGVRIEPGEIETALERHPAVRQAVAVVRTDGPLGARLVGYVVPEEGAGEDLTAELAAYLRELLPAVMVPTEWVVLPAFPLSPNGKVDRRALPVPARPDSAVAGAPRTPAQERMAAIWSEVLGVARVGAADDFFDLGGHSLLATQVASRIQEVFGVHLPLRRMFEASTLAAMTAAAIGATGADAPPPPIRRAPRDGDLPLSFAQERLWLIDRLQPGGSAYNIPLSLLAQGRLDVPRLAAALSGLARRHEVLRTVFAERGGAPVQVVLPAADVPLPVIDLAGLPEDRRESAARRLAAGEAARPFDLARGPLLRGLLIALDARRSRLLLSLHHIVTDGWSMGVLVREVKALYAGSPLPELPVQYADFAVWQRGWLAGEVLEGQLAWWRERLRGVPATLELPLDRPRPPLPSTRGAEHSFALNGDLSQSLAELARREGVTPFMVLAAGLFALLSRLAGQRDLAIGSPIANRHHLETEGLIGFFVNTLVLRADLSRAVSFRDLLRQVREVTLGAYAHQDLPFEKLVDELQPERDLTRSPLFQVVLALQNAPLPQADLGGVRLLPQEIPTGVAKFDLTFLFAEAEDGRLTCLLQYASDLFDPPTAVRYARHLATLLGDLAARPEGRLAEASLLTGEERQQILREWNDTRREWEGDPALHQLFERQADLRPEAVAGICGGENVTYGELDARSNRLAHHLRRLGVRRGEPVGLWMGRSLDLLTAVLGILKSGAVYVPLDAGWPAERVETILTGTGTRVLVAGPGLVAESLECVVYLIDPTLTAAPAERPEPWAGPDDPAYLIHTSGSTGVPKGIVVRHRSAVNTLRWNNEALEIGPGDRHLFINSISFDLSIYDMLGMLGAGAAVRVAAEDELRDPERLAGILRHEGITTWNSAPAALQQLVPFFPPPGEGGRLRRVFLAGDWIPLSLPDLVRTAFPGAIIGNFGGATETSVWSNWFRVDEVDPSWAGIPYGRPLQNTRYYILDADLNPCPPGVPGDNHIGGGCLAFGYAGQPALTAERFIPDPFSDVPGARMYATGDRARFRPDGTMEFLGRVDLQVKVRGYRIELGEIEAALARHPVVREAVVLAREDVPGEKRLVAYVVPSGRPAPETEELRAALSRILPEYMVPWTYVFLEALPVTANGKLDRRALPAPGAAGAGEVEYVAPRNELEKAIAAAWREVLGVERVGVHDNFFETGGSSLLIVKLHARLKETLGWDLPVMELFRYTTVDALARKLADEKPAVQEVRTGEIRERAKTRQDALRQLRQARSERKSR